MRLLTTRYKLSVHFVTFTALVACLLMSLAHASAAHASARYALLVGVSQYPSLHPDSRLSGPANDVQLVQTVLEQQGFSRENIIVLADGVENADGDPTKAAITQALDTIADKVNSEEDFVYLHFSGHGTQLPATGPDSGETDGWDEVFLPLDIGRWVRTGENSEIENALRDDEIGTKLAAIQQAGAFVWAVFDNCHSGSIARSAVSGEVKSRKLNPEMLVAEDDRADYEAAKQEAEIKAAESASTRSRSIQSNAPRGDMGLSNHPRLVAFYAAQSGQETEERTLPKSPLVILDPVHGKKIPNPERQVRGLFTYTLMETVTNNPGISYRQAIDEVLQRYAAARVRISPFAEGGASLDATVFGSQIREQVKQWPVQWVEEDDSLRLEAGSLHRLNVGAVLALMPSAVAKDDEALGYIEVQSPELTQSLAAPIAYAGKDALARDAELPDGAFARLVDPNLSFQLRVAFAPEPLASAYGDTDAFARDKSAYDRLSKLLGDLSSDKTVGLMVDWVEPEDEADVRLLVKDRKLWFLSPGGELITEGASKTHSVGAAGPDTVVYEKIVDNLKSIAKVVNLLNLSNHLAAAAEDLSLELNVTVQQGSNAPVSVLGGSMPSFAGGERLVVEIYNGGKRAVDVTALFLDSDYGITSLGVTPKCGVKQADYRIEPDGTGYVCGKINRDTVGLERIMIIGVPAAEHRQPQPFDFLAQASIPKSKAANSTRGAGFRGMLEQAGFSGGTSRGFGDASAGGGMNQAIMQVFSWTTESQPN